MEPAPPQLARLETAHDRLLREVQDLRLAYETERQRRARVADSAYGFMTVLARTAPSLAS